MEKTTTMAQINIDGIGVGDFARLTDPIHKGEVVKVEAVTESGFIEYIGGKQNGDFEQVEIPTLLAEKEDAIGLDDFLQLSTLGDVCRYIELKTGIKLYPEDAVKHYRHAAEVVAKEHAYYEKAWNMEHAKLLAAQDEIEKLKKK